MKHLLSVKDLSKKDINDIFKLTKKLYNKRNTSMKQKTLAMIFAKPSTRTRISFETGMTQLGGHAIYLGMNDMQLGRGETIADTSKVVSSYVDLIMARLYKHSDIEELAKHSSVPVINGLTDYLHPCQALTDLFTITQFKKLKNLKLCYLGDPNNVSNSLMYTTNKLGVEMHLGIPKGMKPSILEKLDNVSVYHDAKKAVKNVDVVYTDTWFSMGQKKNVTKAKKLKPFQVNSSLMKHAKNNAIVMHDLPAYRGNEITSQVMDGKQSVIFKQAENRMHVQKAIIYWLLSKK